MPNPLLFVFFILFLLRTALGEDTVAEDMGTHQLERLVELLTVGECEDLLSTLSRPEESIFSQLERLSLENNRLETPARKRRDMDREARCHKALTDWLLSHGEQTYHDRLSRALQQIGRTDIAIEVAKNINQDKILSLQRYVEDYHHRVNKAAPHSTQSKPEEHRQEDSPLLPVRRVRDLTWRDLELVVKREALPPYQRQILEGAWPLLYGILLGFAGALLMGGPALLLAIYAANSCQRKSRYRQGRSHALKVVTSADMEPLKTDRVTGQGHKRHSASHGLV